MHWPGTCKVITGKRTCGDARFIDRRIDFECHRQQLGFSRPASIRIAVFLYRPSTQTDRLDAKSSANNDVAGFSRLMESLSRGFKTQRRPRQAPTLFSAAEHVGQNRGGLDLCSYKVLRVAEINSCFDMPASNTSALRPEACIRDIIHLSSCLPVTECSSAGGVSSPRTASPSAWLLSSHRFRVVLLILTQGPREQMF